MSMKNKLLCECRAIFPSFICAPLNVNIFISVNEPDLELRLIPQVQNHSRWNYSV